eukprot:1477962-Rhodomonas_salina.1
MSHSRSSPEIVCAASTHAYIDTLPVTTSFPELNSSPVHVGLSMRIVIAANSLRSYRELGSSSEIR